MSSEDQAYHRQRADQCRAMAQAATDPDIRRRHEELAELHERLIAPSPAPELSAA